MVLSVSTAPHESSRICTVDELHGAVMAEHEIVRHLSYGRPPVVLMASYCQKKLVLGGCQARVTRLLFTPAFKVPQRCAQSKKLGIRRVRQGHANTISSWHDESGTLS